MHPITIIGSGLAGYSVAREFRRLNQEMPLRIVTFEDGHFYSKPMLSNAFFLKKQPQELINTPVTQMTRQLKAEILTHTQVTRLFPQQQLIYIGDQSLQYSQLVLACGASPSRLPLTGPAANEVLAVNELADYTRFYEALQGVKRVAIMGAGLIGCEFANDLQSAGFSVTVIGRGAYPLNRLVPEPVGRVLQHALANLGVSWYLGTTAIHADYAGKGYRLTLADQTILEVDLLFSATGLRPRTDLAANAGLTVNQGIVVNRYLKTRIDNIQALGDCAEVAGLVLLYVMPLMNAARAIAKTLAGELTPVAYPAFPVVVKTTSCPLVLYPPPASVQGDWEIEAEGQNVQALFYTAEKQLVGFALTGTRQSEKMLLLKKVPPLLKSFQHLDNEV